MENQIVATQQKINNRKIDILIVGAGLSGLTSALRINQKQPNLQIRILEVSDRIGGQLKAVSLGEIGAKWINVDQCHIYHLLKTLNVTMRERYIPLSELKTYREIDNGVFSSLANYELNRYINEIEINLECFKPINVEYKRQSMYRHIHNRLFFNQSRKYMLNLVILISGVDAKEIMLSEFLSICYASGGFKSLIDMLIEIPNNSSLEFSSDDFLHNLLENLNNTEILCGRKVISINQYRDFVTVTDSENEKHIAEAIILAIPWNCTQNIFFYPGLPRELITPPLQEDRDKYIITSFLISYTEAHWRLKGFSGQFIKHEPILIAREYRPTIYSGFMIHEEGIEPLVKSIVIHEFAKIFGEEMLIPQEFQQSSYELNNLSHLPLTTPWNRVIWSSSAAAGTCYRGHLGGAVQTGLRAAMNALLICRPQSVSWQDIVEIQCHSFLCRKCATWTTKFFSACNLYNVSTYTIVVCGVLSILTALYQKH